jgi:predicted HAD superfamily Cof-like phosphohydrolase
MKKQIQQIQEFEKSFNIDPDSQPSETKFLILLEELEEYRDAARVNDSVEIADAIGDILYITFGLVTKHGLQDKIENIFDEIHNSNMSKLGADGQPILREDGKILKGPGYFKPNIAKYL